MRILDERIYEGNMRCIYAVGTHSETKPTDHVATGSVFFESDTSDAYMYNEDQQAWAKLGGGN